MGNPELTVQPAPVNIVCKQCSYMALKKIDWAKVSEGYKCTQDTNMKFETGLTEYQRLKVRDTCPVKLDALLWHEPEDLTSYYESIGETLKSS